MFSYENHLKKNKVTACCISKKFKHSTEYILYMHIGIYIYIFKYVCMFYT